MTASAAKVTDVLPEAAGVNIVVADRGWILERLAGEIASRVPYAQINDRADPTSALQYYLNYSSWRGRVSPIEVAYFTHVEKDEGARRRFFEVAAAVDYCVCHSAAYERQLREHGIANVVTISPGVDLDLFKPLVKIGVVGRTYASGRKGEALVRAVQDIEGIAWHFTGSGWPGPGRDVDAADMPAFYNEMDFILVPSLYEGGPMSVVEAVACGTPVIAPPVGWVSEFPHREFRTGDEADLRRVLEEIVAERSEGRAALVSRSWGNWAEQHDLLFARLMMERGLAPAVRTTTVPEPIVLALHSGETEFAGGPSVRAAGTAAKFGDLGMKAKVVAFPDRSIRSAALVHGFNVWKLDGALALARYARGAGKPFVFSPIYLDQSEFRLWNTLVQAVARDARDTDEFEALMRQAVDDFRGDRRRGDQAAPGYDAAARALLDMADATIFLSTHERDALARVGAVSRQGRIVRNPVDADRFADADPKAFGRHIGARDYILCVGRIEPRKNQLMLLHALHGINVPIVLIGAESDAGYMTLLGSLRTANVRVFGRIDPNDPLLASAFAGARLVVQPSWVEGAPIAALEGAAAGASLILSNRSAEQEYFGDLARYCDPSDPVALRATILDAYESPLRSGARRALQEMVRERYSYERHARETLEVYEAASSRFAKPVVRTVSLARDAPDDIVVDISSLVYRVGSSGLVAGQRAIAEALLEQCGPRVSFVAWNVEIERYVGLDRTCIRHDDLLPYVDFAAKNALEPDELTSGQTFLVLGSMWMWNAGYCRDLVTFADAFGLSLSVFVHEVSWLRPVAGGSAADAAGLRANLDLVLLAAASIIVTSQATSADVETFAAERGLELAPVTVLRLGDGLTRHAAADAELPADLDGIAAAGFVLSVATAGIGDDERVLFRIWEREVERLGDGCPYLVVAVPRANPGSRCEIEHRPDARMLIVTNVPDGLLSALFDRALLVVVAPGPTAGREPVITDSLARGRICIAPANGLAAEAGGALADLIDPLDLPAWASRLEYYLRSASARAQRETEIAAQFEPTSWAGATERLRLVLRERHARAGGRYTIGLAAKVGNLADGIRKRGGWHRSEDWGCWSADRSCGFSFDLPAAHDGDLMLLLEMRSELAFGQDNVCSVFVNERSAGRLVLRGSGWALMTLPVAGHMIAGATRIDVEIRGSRLVDLPADDLHQAPRRAGIALATIALADPAYAIDYNGYATQRNSTASCVRIGEDIDLTRDPRARRMMPSAATVGTDWGVRQMDGRPQLLVKIIDRGLTDIKLTLRYRAVASAAAPLRATIATREGVTVGTIEADDDRIREVELRIPGTLKVQPLWLDFIGAEKLSPYSLGVGLREEAFGIGFFDIRIESADGSHGAPRRPIEPYRLGQTISFRNYDRDRTALASTRFIDPRTWHHAEAEGSWTQGVSGRVQLALDRKPEGPLHLRVDAACLIHAGDPFTALIRANGQEIHAALVRKNGLFTMIAVLPPGLVGDDRVLTLDIGADRAFSPSLIGTGVDDRQIALRVAAIRLSEDRDALAILPGEEIGFAEDLDAIVAARRDGYREDALADDDRDAHFVGIDAPGPFQTDDGADGSIEDAIEPGIDGPAPASDVQADDASGLAGEYGQNR